MKLNEFFINCLNRRSFQLLSFTGCFLLLCLLFFILFCILNMIDSYDFLAALFIFLLFILPTFGLISMLSIIAIYLKLLFREYRNPDYRIKNKFLTQNPIYGVFAFLCYFLGFFSVAGLIYLAYEILKAQKENVFFSHICIYPFLIYTLILVFVTKKI